MPVIRPSTMSRARRSRAEMRASVLGSRYLRYSAVWGSSGMVERSQKPESRSQKNARNGPCASTVPQHPQSLRRLRHRFVAPDLGGRTVQFVELLPRDEVDK